MTQRTPEITHKIMSAIKSKNTRPEVALRRALWTRGLRYRINVKSLPGKPDIVFTRAKIVEQIGIVRPFAVVSLANLAYRFRALILLTGQKIQIISDSSIPEIVLIF